MTTAALPFTVDERLAERTAIGLIVLANEQTAEHEWKEMLGGVDGVDVYESRMATAPVGTRATLAAMAGEIEDAAARIAVGPSLGSVALCCASGAMVVGEERSCELLRRPHPHAHGTTPIIAAVAGLRALGARSVAIVTPYLEPMHTQVCEYVAGRGLAVPATGSFAHDDYDEISRISVGSIGDAIERVGGDDGVDAVFLCCTSLRAAAALDDFEARIGKPVISSNQALAWHALRLAGRADAVAGFGSLLRTPLR